MLSSPGYDVEVTHTHDVPPVFNNFSEPFSYTLRSLDIGGVKFISWYIAEVDEDAPGWYRREGV